jgi:hypothetical protein
VRDHAAAVHAGRLWSLLVHQLAHSVVVLPPAQHKVVVRRLVLISPSDEWALAGLGSSVSGCGIACHDRIFARARAVGVLSGRDMVVAGVGEAPVLCLLGERRSILPSPSEAMRNSSVESPIMAPSRDCGSQRVEPMMMVSESSPMGDRLRPLKQSVMNLRLPKKMVSPWEKALHDRR